jgi:integrating conjugative element protein (TIGR03757 family)
MQGLGRGTVRLLALRPPFPAGLLIWLVTVAILVSGSAVVNAEALPEQPITVLAFTDSRHYPLNHTDLPDVKVTVYDLAAPKLAMAKVNAALQLPANPALATQLAKDYLKAHEAELGQQLLPTYAGLSQAVNLGLNQYPALVFNHQAVIIGVTDIQQGLAIYQQWLQGQQP